MEERKYTVYKHTSPEGKVYVGCTSTSPKRRWGMPVYLYDNLDESYVVIEVEEHA